MHELSATKIQFMAHISTAHPGGPLSQQVQRNFSSMGILAAATEVGSFC